MAKRKHSNDLRVLAQQYAVGRWRRGEIGRPACEATRYTLMTLTDSFGDRPASQLGQAAIDEWLEFVSDRSPQTRRNYISRVRGFCRWLVAEGIIRFDPTTHIPRVRQPRRDVVTFTPAQVGRLLASLPDKRARAMVWLMVGCGCRCVEVARLRVEDYDPVGRTVRLRGKNDHERVIPVTDGAATALDEYLEECGHPLIGPMIRNRMDPTRGIDPPTVSHYVRNWLNEAGVKATPLDGRSAHGLRRTAASDVMDNCGDIRAVQQMLGHARAETTARYYVRSYSLNQLREAMDGRTYE